MNTTLQLTGVAALLLVVASAHAAPCGLGPSDLLCDEFEYGDEAGNVNNNAFWNRWIIDTDPTSCQISSVNEIVWIDDETWHDHVFYGSYSCMGKQEKLETIGSGHNVRDLTPRIDARTPGAQAVNGTDENPLELAFYLDLNTSGKQWELVRYVELAMGDDEAPTDHWEVTCWNGATWPVFPERVPFPGNGVKAAFAVGAVAYLDEDPCYPDTYKRPNAYQLAVFDGLAWYRLKANLFSPDEFDLEERWHYIRVTIKTNMIHVWMRAKERGCQPWCPICCDANGGKIPDCAGCWIEYSADIPRQYLGPFNKVAIGNGGCLDARWPSWVDSLGIGGGVDVSPFSAACCLPDGTCVETTQADCQTLGGSFRNVPTCTATACCPIPFADSDQDGDVDHDDFGAFQICYNGAGAVPTGCDCFDRNTDGKIDATDFNAFNSCFTGPNVPWSQAIAPICVP